MRKRTGNRSAGLPSNLRRKQLIIALVAGSLAVHIVALVLFGLFKMAAYFQEEEATFIVQGNIVLPAETREHKIAMAQHAAITSKPIMDERLVSIRETEFSLPDLPTLPMDQLLALDPSTFISDHSNALIGASGSGSGSGAELSGVEGSTASGVSFFNMKDTARSVVIMIDISASMFGRTGDLDYDTNKLMRQGKDQSFQVVRDEAIRLVEGLSVNTLFGIIHWSGSARLWKETLVPATASHKAEARIHIQERVDYSKAPPTGGRPGGTRHDYALEALFSLQPEVAFMLTDGNATRSLEGGSFEVISERELLDLISEASKPLDSPPRIHTVYYLTGKDQKDEEHMLRSIARKTKGRFSKQEAPKKE